MRKLLLLIVLFLLSVNANAILNQTTSPTINGTPLASFNWVAPLEDCTPTETPETSCSDTIDNDCDGYIDGDDPDCATPDEPDYYVIQSGDGIGDGSDLANAMSVSTFNSQSGDKHGMHYSFSGEFTTRINPAVYGTSSGNVVLDGWSGGDCDPNTAECTSSAILNAGLWLNGGGSYITIQDFRSTGGEATTRQNWAIYNTQSLTHSSNIIIRRNYIYDTNAGMLGFLQSYYGGSYGSGYHDYITIENNKGIGYSRTQLAEQGVNLVRCTNLIVRSNDFGGDAGTHQSSSGDNVIETHSCSNALFEYNELHHAYEQSGIAIKEPTTARNNNIILRFNKFYNNGLLFGGSEGKGLGLGCITGAYVYCNYFYNNEYTGLDIKDADQDIFIWSNIFNKTGIYHGIVSWYRTGAVDNIVIRNNTFFQNGTAASASDHAGITIKDTTATNVDVENNLFHTNKPGGSGYCQAYYNSSLSGDVTMEHNGYYYYYSSSEQTPTVYYLNSYDNMATLQAAGLEDDAPAGENENPYLTDPDSGDFTRAGTNVNDGADLSGTVGTLTIQGTSYPMYWDTALLPSTDWSAFPSSSAVLVGDQDDYGAGWERGAYVYQ
jgi:hypothetical protein